MYKFATIVLARFPYTDSSGYKLRPALIISRKKVGRNVIVCFIGSNKEKSVYGVEINKSKDTGIKKKSIIRFDKVMTIDQGLILGEIGCLDSKWLKEQTKIFLSVFGFKN